MFVGDGHAAFYHVGRYPIRPADVDERLPIPGTGGYDWRGFERWSDQPHVVDPPGGVVANWNKPATGWYSKGLLSATFPEGTPVVSIWGPAHQVEPIQADLATRAPSVTFEDMAAIEKHVASVDNRARVFLPYLLHAIDASHDPSLGDARAALASWDGLRTDADRNGSYDAPGLALFDKWMDLVLLSTFDGVLPHDVYDAAAGMGPDLDLRSYDNGDTPSFKFENVLYGTLLHALRGDAHRDWFGGDARSAVVGPLHSAIDALKGSWKEPVEVAHFAAQGAGSVDDIAPLPNRGSYGQIVEAGGTPG